MIYSGIDECQTFSQLFVKSLIGFLLPLLFYLGGPLLN